MDTQLMVKHISRPIRDVAPPAIIKRKPIVDPELLLDDEAKARIRAKAEEKIRLRDQEAAEEAYLTKMLDEADRKIHPEVAEEMRSMRLDLPPFADRVIIDGKQYIHGGLYEFTKRQFDCIMEMVWNAFRHDDEVHNRRNVNAYRRERELTMSATTGNIIDRDGRPAVKF